MDYDLKNFGSCLRYIRRAKDMTQKSIAEKALLNQETLRKIENGLVIPKQETLDLLSGALNVDMQKIFLYYRNQDKYNSRKLKRQIERHLENEENSFINEDIKLLKRSLTNIKEEVIRNEIYHFIFMIEGIMLDYNGEYKQAIDKYICASQM